VARLVPLPQRRRPESMPAREFIARNVPVATQDAGYDGMPGLSVIRL
jgi:antitoxin (DNA-binding transcriptional repressor) of toxin-antitoxin stability system